jgi:hypothetical protein
MDCSLLPAWTHQNETCYIVLTIVDSSMQHVFDVAPTV